MRSLRAAIAVLAAGLIAAGCGPLPRPFQPEEKPRNALLQLPDRAGIVVLPTVGAPGEIGAAATAAMLAGLRARHIPAAEAGGNQESRVLHSRAVLEPRPGAGSELLLTWELRGAGGETIGTHGQRWRLAHSGWWLDDAEHVRDMAAAAAPAIADLIQGPADEMAAIPGFPRARLVILPLAAAPGDGEVSLPRALHEALLAARLPVAEEADDDDLLVLGEVELGPPERGVQAVAVRWQVRSASDHEELGEIAQRNSVPAGRLDGAWGPIAREIAEAAAAGMQDLLERAGRL